MSWTYQQSTGRLLHNGRLVDARGYSGRGASRNVPQAQALRNEWPIPQGRYAIGQPFNNPTRGGHHGTGPYSIRLTPAPSNQMFGRSSFLIHGDSLRAPGTASDGCIILGVHTRHAIVASGDHALEVVP